MLGASRRQERRTDRQLNLLHVWTRHDRIEREAQRVGHFQHLSC